MARKKSFREAINVNESDLVQKKKKTPNTLNGETIIITGKADKEEKKFNKKIAIKKESRPAATKMKCQNVNCTYGIGGKPFEGVESLFSPNKGLLLCSNCLLKSFGS